MPLESWSVRYTIRISVGKSAGALINAKFETMFRSCSVIFVTKQVSFILVVYDTSMVLFCSRDIFGRNRDRKLLVLVVLMPSRDLTIA